MTILKPPLRDYHKQFWESPKALKYIFAVQWIKKNRNSLLTQKRGRILYAIEPQVCEFLWIQFKNYSIFRKRFLIPIHKLFNLNDESKSFKFLYDHFFRDRLTKFFPRKEIPFAKLYTVNKLLVFSRAGIFRLNRKYICWKFGLIHWSAKLFFNLHLKSKS